MLFSREPEATALESAIVDHRKNIEEPVGRGPASQTGETERRSNSPSAFRAVMAND
jgi:hypothetical protein